MWQIFISGTNILSHYGSNIRLHGERNLSQKRGASSLDEYPLEKMGRIIVSGRIHPLTNVLRILVVGRILRIV